MKNTKICKKCGRELPLSEFYKDKSRKDGLEYRCKECKKQYKVDNREYILEYHKQYNAEHKAERAVYMKQRRATLEGYTYNIRHSNLYEDRKHGRCGEDEDPLPPHSYYIEKFSEGVDYYDGRKYPFNELGFDRIDDKLPHTIDNIVVATAFHNKDRWYKHMTVEEYREYIQQQNEELELVL
jgi:hypothetical protein